MSSFHNPLVQQYVSQVMWLTLVCRHPTMKPRRPFLLRIVLASPSSGATQLHSTGAGTAFSWVYRVRRHGYECMLGCTWVPVQARVRVGRGSTGYPYIAGIRYQIMVFGLVN